MLEAWLREWGGETASGSKFQVSSSETSANLKVETGDFELET
jgi:hypothetical protein